MARKTTEDPTHINVDLTKLSDHAYMEVLTGTPAWARLEMYMRGSFLVNFLDQLRTSALPEDVRHQVTQVFLRSLSDEERRQLEPTIEVSDLLDTLIDLKKGH